MQIRLNIICAIVLYVLCSVHIIYAKKSCTNFIKFKERNDTRVGRFEILTDKLKNDSYVEITVFLADNCQRSLCVLVMATNVDMASEWYKSGQPVPYKIYFRGASKYAWVKGIAVRGSSQCKIVCKNERDYVNSTTNTLKHALYVDGKSLSTVAPCNPLDLFTSDIVCGVVPPTAEFIYLVINGKQLERGSWPWMVAIFHRDGFKHAFNCGGTIINQRVILTAAHCFYHHNETRGEKQEKDIYVLLGKHNLLDYKERGYIVRYARNISIHPEYRPYSLNFDADVALIFTDQDIKYSDYIRPACIWDGPDSEDSLPGVNGTVVGWGWDETATTSEKLKLVTATVIKYEICAQNDRTFQARTTKRNFCAGDVKDRSSTPCAGDSGGGFFVKESDQWKVRAIVSNTVVSNNSTCDLQINAVYTNIAKFRDWINQEINKLSLFLFI